MDLPSSGSAGGLISFLSWLKEKGLMPGRTADAWRSAAQAVLSVDGQGWEDLDLRDLDLQAQFQRFSNMRGTKYTPASLRSYGQRFRDSVEMYFQYLANPTGFKPRVSVVAVRSPGAGQRRTQSRSADGPAAETTGSAMPSQPSGSGAGAPKLLTYPFPLAGGELAYLQLPVLVSLTDVERLCAFIRSIAIERPGD